MIRLPKTKIHNSIDKIDEHLDVIYQLKNAFVEVDKDVLINLSDSIDTWKSCILELEFEINSVNTIEHELENNNNTEEELMNKIGVNTELLNKEQLHTRETTLSILGVSPKTLWNFQKGNLIKGTTFKGRRYYSKDAIIDCIKMHFNITTSTEFDNMWD